MAMRLTPKHAEQLGHASVPCAVVTEVLLQIGITDLLSTCCRNQWMRAVRWTASLESGSSLFLGPNSLGSDLLRSMAAEAQVAEASRSGGCSP